MEAIKLLCQLIGAITIFLAIIGSVSKEVDFHYCFAKTGECFSREAK